MCTRVAELRCAEVVVGEWLIAAGTREGGPGGARGKAQCPVKGLVWGLVVASSDVELAHLVLKRRAFQAQALRRAILACNPPRSGF